MFIIFYKCIRWYYIIFYLMHTFNSCFFILWTSFFVHTLKFQNIYVALSIIEKYWLIYFEIIELLLWLKILSMLKLWFFNKILIFLRRFQSIYKICIVFQNILRFFFSLTIYIWWILNDVFILLFELPLWKNFIMNCFCHFKLWTLFFYKTRIQLFLIQVIILVFI